MPAVVAPVHAAVVLLIQSVPETRSHDDAVHALPMLGISLVVGQEICAGALVPRLPRCSAIGSVEDAPGGDPDPDLLVIVRMQDDRMQDQPAPARLPLGSGGV